MRGKLMSLHGLPSSYVMGRSSTGPVLGMICVCTPFVPPSNSEMTTEDLILKTKHQLDGSLISMDQKYEIIVQVINCFAFSRVSDMLEISDASLPMSLYTLIHVEDAICMAEAHKEVIKNGSSGLLVYRLISTKTRKTYFAQCSCRLFYKNSKPESIGLTHRLLNEVEGTMLLEKRSSLKAKLLSFDDSFLQSPRNLQSTAALPLPTVMKEDDDSLSPSTSTALFPTISIPILPSSSSSTKVRRRKDDQILLPPSIPLNQPPPIFEMPQMFDPSWSTAHHPWPHDAYAQYPGPYVYHSEVPIASIDYSTWQNNEVHMQMGTPIPHTFAPENGKNLHQPAAPFVEYPIPHPVHQNSLKQDSFHLISEVNNLLT
uniref:PAS domain-containing protein n=1 Tax=Caenorhabditis japonica TaxID=281687 RepID=A0A8R1E7S4_CAEJA